VLAAVGREQGEPRKWAPTPRVWRVEPFAYDDQASWELDTDEMEALSQE
jgi:hypothetical protein